VASDAIAGVRAVPARAVFGKHLDWKSSPIEVGVPIRDGCGPLSLRVFTELTD
jgi:hypothetical protein